MTQAEDKLLLIRNYDLWSHLTDDEYHEINFLDNYVEAKKGEYLYFEAFNHNRLYFIKEGNIRIGYIDAEGKEVVKEILQKGEIFGQITLERDNLNGEFAQAYKADVSLCVFTIDSFLKLLQRKPGLALRYSKWVGFKLRRTENRLVNLLNKDVKSRLVNFLWQQAQPHTQSAATNSLRISNHLTHEDIAHLIGSSRQTVTTMINELSTEGLLIFNRNEISFPNINAFQKLANA